MRTPGSAVGYFGHRDPEVAADLHALQDEIDAEALLPLHLPQARPYVVFLADALFGPFERYLMIARKGLHPLVVIGGALAQDFLADGADPVHLAEEVHNVFQAREQRHMAQDDDAVKTVVYESQQAPKPPHEIFHRSSCSLAFCVATRASDRGPVEIKEISNIFG